MATSVCLLTNVHHPLDQRIFYKQALSLVRAGHRVVVVGPGPAALAGCREGVEIRTMPQPRSLWGRLRNLGRVLRAGWGARAQVYHLHDPELLPVGLLLRLMGKQVFYDVHEHFPQVALVRGWVPRRLRRPLAALVNRAERFGARWLNGVVGVVEEQGPRFRHRPFVAVKNFPRLEWFPPANGQARTGAELIHVGSLSEDRGAFLLLEIMRLLGQTHPQVRLLTLGPFHTARTERVFRERIRAYGLEGRVECQTTEVPYQDLGPLIRASRIGLVPGQISPKNLTPFVPTKLFEYLACGLPVVASALPSIRGFYAAADWGILVAPPDPAAHARAIAHLLDHPAEARAKGARGRMAVEARFNWAQEEQKLLAFYAHLEEVSR
ncbi:MAG: glycosyltransferase [Candidatus Latescibacteria bacterium]|nr:glycosyltransferase [Candidatus Latescibacterota bacterium]